MLQIRLFGKPQVICDGTDITPELGNKGCALLCILFLRGGDYYAREKLAAYLWPDSAVSAGIALNASAMRTASRAVVTAPSAFMPVGFL